MEQAKVGRYSLPITCGTIAADRQVLQNGFALAASEAAKMAAVRVVSQAARLLPEELERNPRKCHSVQVPIAGSKTGIWIGDAMPSRVRLIGILRWKSDEGIG